MQKVAFPLLLLLLVSLFWGCKPTEPNAAKPGKWLSYPERATLQERLLRARLHVEKREGMSNTLTDSGEVWFPSEIILYNDYGQPTLVQMLDAKGTVTKETRYDYRDSLLLREVVTESSGYSADMRYQYDAQGHKSEEMMFQRGDSLLRRVYKVDALGNEIEVNLDRFRDHSHLTLVTKRDALGQPVTVSEMQEGKANWTETYTITDSVWRIQRTDSQNQIQGDYEMRIAKGAVTQMINRDEHGKTRMSITYTNDDQGRLVKEQYFGAQGQPLQGAENKYNDQGLLIEHVTTSPSVSERLVTRYTYTFRNIQPAAK